MLWNIWLFRKVPSQAVISQLHHSPNKDRSNTCWGSGVRSTWGHHRKQDSPPHSCCLYQRSWAPSLFTALCVFFIFSSLYASLFHWGPELLFRANSVKGCPWGDHQWSHSCPFSRRSLKHSSQRASTGHRVTNVPSCFLIPTTIWVNSGQNLCFSTTLSHGSWASCPANTSCWAFIDLWPWTSHFTFHSCSLGKLGKHCLT